MLTVRGAIGPVGQPGDLPRIRGHRLQLFDDAVRLAVQHVRRVEQLRGHQAAHHGGHRRGVRAGVQQQDTGSVRMLDALAGDVADLQRQDGPGDLPADLLRSRPNRGDGAGRRLAVRFDRRDAGGKVSRNTLHRTGVALGKALCAVPRGPQIPVGAGQFLCKLVKLRPRQCGRTADLVGEQQEAGTRLTHAHRDQPRVQRQNVHFLQDRVHPDDATSHRTDRAGQGVQCGDPPLLHVRQRADAQRGLAKIEAGPGQLGAPQFGKQRPERRREAINDAHRLFEAATDFEKA